MRTRVRALLAAPMVALGLAALLPSSPVGANGTETLGPITVAPGSGIVTEGVGMLGTNSGTVNLTVPANATVRQVLLWWEGLYSNVPDDTIRVNGAEVTGAVVGGPTVFYGTTKSTTYRADITGLNAVHAGANSVQLSDVVFDEQTDGASIAVVYDDNSGPADVQVRDGNDDAYLNFAPPLDTTTPQVFTVQAASFSRTAKLTLAVGGVDVNRGNTVRVTVGGVATDFDYALHNTDGAQWDDVAIPVTVPAGGTTVAVQVLSTYAGGDPASLQWVNATLSMAGGGGTCAPTAPTPATTHGSAYGADARILGGLVHVDKASSVASQAPGTPGNQASNPITVNVPGLVAAKILSTSSNSKLSPSVSTATASLADVSLLNGLVRATAVKGVSQSFASPFASSSNSNGSAVVGLTVGGSAVVVKPNLNLDVKVLGLVVAKLTVLEESGTSSFANGVSSAKHSINGLRLVLVAPYLGFPPGTTVTLSHAQSDAQSPISSCPDAKSVSGEAFTAKLDGDLLGKDFLDVRYDDAVLPPTGGQQTVTTAGVNVPGVVFSQTAFDTTAGSLSPNPHAGSQSVVQYANVLNGLVTADVLDVRATSSADGTTAGTTFATNFVNLKVAGVAVKADVNAHVVVKVGTLLYADVVVNEQMRNTSGGTDTEGTVNAVHVRLYNVVDKLFRGEVVVASAHSDAHV